MENFCVNCKFYRQGAVYTWCRHPNLGVNPVDGKIDEMDCSDVRRDNSRCGKQGKWYEDKDESKKKKLEEIIEKTEKPSRPPSKLDTFIENVFNYFCK